MNLDANAKQPGQLMKSKDVIAYLKQNPSFFEQYGEVLAGLKLPHGNPFHERQVEVWRQRHSKEKARYERVVETARQNLELERLLHQFACRLLSQKDWDLDTLSVLLADIFEVEGVRFCLRDAHHLPDDHFDRLMERIQHGGSICDERVSSTLLALLFGMDHSIRSCAFIPLETDTGKGLLVLGSVMEERFQVGLGVIFLDRIRDLLSTLLCRAPK